MPHKIEKKEENKVEMIITIPAAEVEEGMKHAAEHLAEETNIPGFRPGKAPYDVVKQRVGEMKLLEAAAEELIRKAFVEAMLEEDLETVGQPYFDVEKMAPGNDMIVKVEIALYPHVTELADYSSLQVEKKDTKPSQELIEQAKKDLTSMQTKETRKPAGEILESGDKVVVNLTMKKDGVVLEGGEGQDHGIYTAETYYIEGFLDQIIGSKEGETKTFTLKFPKDHYQKHLAGTDVEFIVEIKEIFKLETPTIDDEFAKKLGLKDKADLETKLIENLSRENEVEETMRQDKEVLDKIAEKTKFEKISDLLVNQEIEKMLHELRHNIGQRGLEFDEYLKQLGKTVPELKLDFTPAALRRVEVGILLKEVANKESISVEPKEVDEELDKIAAQYEDEKVKKQIFAPEYRDYVEHQMRNRKAIDFLKSKIVK
ncbi:trigger factor [Patescibacteria group bacterium]|nr:trigger factor [Patescibacteria group bacterium]